MVSGTEAGGLKRALLSPVRFADLAGVKLRKYQAEVVQAVAASVLHGWGLSFVVMFPRQSGKNEAAAHLEAYLLTRLSMVGGEIVKISPTWKPQSLNAMRRLDRALVSNGLLRGAWFKEQGYSYRIGAARCYFLSGGPEASIVGQTASALLEVDEAQDVTIEKYDKDIAPMAASTNATRVFWGTAWTSSTLLARELRAARSAERLDGRRRVFVCDADVVGAEVPEYAAFVAEQVARLGRDSIAVKTQYYSEEIDQGGALFDARRLALMRGDHPRVFSPQPGAVYAFLLDVAGVDEGTGAPGELRNPGRDITALTVVQVDTTDARRAQPTYKVVQRRGWVGVSHSLIYGELIGLADLWRPHYVVVDSTGVGAGLASFLSQALPGRVVPVEFTQARKSDIGWSFLAVVDGGRWREYSNEDAEQRELWAQLAACEYEVLAGPGRVLRWGVPDGRRSPAGSLIHDDWILSAALVSELDKLTWGVPGVAVLPGRDPLSERGEW